jgi:hypothetical protein
LQKRGGAHYFFCRNVVVAAVFVVMGWCRFRLGDDSYGLWWFSRCLFVGSVSTVVAFVVVGEQWVVHMVLLHGLKVVGLRSAVTLQWWPTLWSGGGGGGCGSRWPWWFGGRGGLVAFVLAPMVASSR